ncbi:pyroglutamyl-peptidase I [Candidatus Leptofilum sp.]|uniref:pyroglutamyl-peptidase I n=1 Tax=Candidatus Leptofilum sp. TaxID=3241576 RepID=UPI003B5C0A49
MMKFLVTGFEPFGQSSINPSEQVVRHLAAMQFEEFGVATAVLPVHRTRGSEALITAVLQTQPDAIICLGEAGGRHAISIERVAINLMDYGLADNDGQLVQDAPIEPDGPAAYFTTLPVRKLMLAVQNGGIPAELSLTAGAYLCNQVTYELLHFLAKQQLDMPAGFVHLPFLPQQAAVRPGKFPSMALETMVTAVTTILTTLHTKLCGTITSARK